MKCQVVLLGNHDQGAMFDPEGFNPQAERAIFWTRAQLEAPITDRFKMAEQLGVPGGEAASAQGEWFPVRAWLGPQSDQ